MEPQCSQNCRRRGKGLLSKRRRPSRGSEAVNRERILRIRRTATRLPDE